MENQTLETLKNGPFNKIRMCIFPKHYLYNANDPAHFPFPGGKTEGGYQWDFSKFDPEYWRIWKSASVNCGKWALRRT